MARMPRLDDISVATERQDFGPYGNAAAAQGGLPPSVVEDIFNGVKDAPASITRGIANAGNELLQTAAPLAVKAAELGGVMVPHKEAYMWHKKALDENYEQTPEDRDFSLPEGTMEAAGELEIVPQEYLPDESKSITGNAIESTTQFMVGQLAFSKVFKTASWAGKGASYAKKILAGTVTGAATDLTMFDEQEDRLSNLIEQVPALQNPITAFLASDENDSWALAKVKNVLEGAALGIAADAFIEKLIQYRAARYLVDPDSTKLSKSTVENLVDEIAAIGKEESDYMVQVGSDVKTGNPIYKLKKQSGRFQVKETPEGFTIKDTSERGKSIGDSPIYKDRKQAWGEAQVLNRILDDKIKNRKAWTARSIDKIPAETKEAIEKDFKTIVELAERGEAMTLDELSDGIEGAFNFKYNASGTETKAMINAVAETLGSVWKESAGLGNISHKAQVKLAEQLLPHLKGDAALAMADEMFKSSQRLPAQLLAGNYYLNSYGKKLAELSALMDMNPDMQFLADEFSQMVDHYVNFAVKLRGTQASTGRALEIMKHNTDDMFIDEHALSEASQHKADAKFEKELGPVKAGSKKDVSNTVDRPKDFKPKEPRTKPVEGKYPFKWLTSGINRMTPYINGYWMNSVLSGPITHVTAILSNIMHSVQMPLERYWSGYLRGDKEVMQEGSDILVGLYLNMRDSWSMAKKAFDVNGAILDPYHSTVEPGVRESTRLVKWNWLNNVLTASTRFLMTSDEMIKNMNYRAFVQAQALKEARQIGITGADGLAKHVDEAMEAAFFTKPNFDTAGNFLPMSVDEAKKVARRIRLAGEDLSITKAFNFVEGQATMQNALKYSRKATFTEDLVEGSVGKHVQNTVNGLPILRVVAPFVRTPVKLMHFTWERAPILAHFKRTVQEDFAAGGRRAAMAQAKLDFGTAVWTTGALLASCGVIQGGGPQDPELRRQWLAAGNKPYSIKIGNWQFSFGRMDPFFAPLGIIADIIELSSDVSEYETSSLATTLAASVARNVTSKSYLTGISRALDAVNSGQPRKMERFIRTYAASFVPNIFNQLNPDDVYRETRSVVDEFKARIPGLSATLPPRRNIFGEPILKAPASFGNRAINPFTITFSKGDEAIDNELIELGKAISFPSERWGNVDITENRWKNKNPEHDGKTPYDRMLELVADPGKGQLTLRKRLEALLKSPVYKHASGGTDLFRGGQRLEMVQQIVKNAYDVAKQKVLVEYPDLRNETELWKVAEQASAAGDDATVQRLTKSLEDIGAL